MSEYAESEQGFADQLVAKLSQPEEAVQEPAGAPESVEQVQDGQEAQPEQETAQEASERLYAGKYKSEQELEDAYLELQQRMGSQGNELGEVRGRLAQLEQASYQQQQPQYNYSLEQVVEAAESNPQETAVWAIQNAPESYDTVMDVWYQVDAKGASRFEQQIMAQALREQIRMEMAPAVAPMMEMGQQSAFYQAWSEVAKANPEINNYTRQIVETAEAVPEIIGLLRNGDLESKQRTITQLYWMARGRNADTLAAAAQGVLQEQQNQNQQAKSQAQVVTSSGVSNADTTSQDRVAAWKRQFREAAGLPLNLGE